MLYVLCTDEEEVSIALPHYHDEHICELKEGHHMQVGGEQEVR